MVANLSIRPASLEDAAHIPDIEISSGAAFRSVPGLEWIAEEGALPDEKIRGWIDRSTAWVAEDGDGRLIGFIVCENTGDASHIMQLSVRDDCQQRGIGKALIGAAIAAAQKLEISLMALTTFRDVAFNGPFYAKLGFEFIEKADLNDRLRSILRNEEAEGLPIDRRCAMQMPL